MNWKLILLLSLFGLAMGVATVFVIPSAVEPAFWLPIFVFCGVLIARMAKSQHFLHGVYLGLVNAFWVTGAHILFADRYLATHPSEANMMKNVFVMGGPRATMAFTAPMIGVISGVVIGLFAVIASRFVKPVGGGAKPA